MHSVLITGSNRGLGLEWAEQMAEAGWRVYATCRDPEHADSLNMLQSAFAKNLTVHRLDVTHQDEISALAEALRGHPIDRVINNAGVYFEKYLDEPLGQINYQHWEETFRVNTLGAVRLSEAFVEHVAASRLKQIVAISSHMGSIAEIAVEGDYAYRSSKAALNAAMKGLAHEVQARGLSVFMLHPGWVQTRMGGPGAPLTTMDSVKRMRQVLEGVQAKDSGRFFRYDGSVIPW